MADHGNARGEIKPTRRGENMLKFEYLDAIKRKIRMDDLADLGVPTGEMICRAIDSGNYDTAKALARYFVPESKGLHDLYCDWTYDIFDKVAQKHGEEAMFELMRATQSTWMMRRTWKGLSKMTPFQRLALNAEVFRAHRCGPSQDGGAQGGGHQHPPAVQRRGDRLYRHRCAPGLAAARCTPRSALTRYVMMPCRSARFCSLC